MSLAVVMEIQRDLVFSHQLVNDPSKRLRIPNSDENNNAFNQRSKQSDHNNPASSRLLSGDCCCCTGRPASHHLHAHLPCLSPCIYTLYATLLCIHLVQ